MNTVKFESIKVKKDFKATHGNYTSVCTRTCMHSAVDISNCTDGSWSDAATNDCMYTDTITIRPRHHVSFMTQLPTEGPMNKKIYTVLTSCTRELWKKTFDLHLYLAKH